MISAGTLRHEAFVITSSKDALGQRVEWERTGAVVAVSLDHVGGDEIVDAMGSATVNRYQAVGRWHDVEEAGVTTAVRLEINDVVYSVVSLRNVRGMDRRAEMDLIEVRR